MRMKDMMENLDKMVVSKALQEWVDSFPRTAAADSEFNLLKAASGSLNENAHTRILAALLRIKPVRLSFFAYLDREYPQRGLDRILAACDEPTAVRCFESYLDACIAVGRFRIVIENKARGACDQSGQIDRYVDTVREQGVDGKDVFVLYVTQNGGFPGDDSFRRAKDVLDCKDDRTGRLFALSYLKDVRLWLHEMIDRKIWSGLAAPDCDMLESGIVQYANYVEGQDLLGLREERDGYEDFRKGVIKDLSTWTLPKIMTVCTGVEFLMLQEREHLYKSLDESLFLSLDRKEKQWLLKTLFYRAFDVAVPDEAFYVEVPIMVHRTDDMTAAVGLWEDTEDSAVQVDVWCANENSLTYDDAFHLAFEGVEETFRCRRMTWNGKETIRFRVSTLGEMCAVIRRIGGKIPLKVEAASPDESVRVGKIDGDELLRQTRAAVNNFCSREQISFGDDRWDLWGLLQTKDDEGRLLRADHRYAYVNGWAIQLYENPREGLRAFDVFAKRGTESDDVCALPTQMSETGFVCRTMRWDGRVFYRFPLPTREYAEELLRALWGWRRAQAEKSSLDSLA